MALPLSPVTAAPSPAPALLAHWVERLREMVQDAARKGERMSESQEKVSSAVQRVTRRIEDESRDLEGLVARLTPMGATSSPSPPSRDLTAQDPPASRTLRLLDPDAQNSRRRDDSSAEEEGGI